MKEILLAIISGPGTGFTVIVVALIAGVSAAYCFKQGTRAVYEDGKQAARREGLENLQVTLAKLVHDQADMKQRLMPTQQPSPTYPDDSDYRP